MNDPFVALAFFGVVLLVFCIGGALAERYLIRDEREDETCP